MKIFMFTDLHSDLKILEKVIRRINDSNPDVVICSGDLADYEKGLDKIIRKLKQTKKLTLVIHGNHESEESMKSLCSDNIIFLHKRSYSIGNYTFFGYGGNGFIQEDKKLESLIPKVKKVTKENLIFITHMPPYNTKLDYLSYSKRHVGSISTTKFIKELKPAIVIAGHLHENFNKQDKIGKSILINPGPEGQLIEI